jgi:protein tyrosine phosphatase (PTP) superfamily phosphohydrolase (DUF442 family)
MTSDLQNIEAFLPISATLATSGQLTTAQFSTIQSADYRLIVNLATSASTNWNPDEPTIVEGLGMEYIGIPIEWDYPTLGDFEDLVEVLEDNSDCKIWVHCAKNMRVSAMLYLYNRLHKGYGEATCRSYLEQIWQPNEIWQNFIDATLALHSRD